MASTGARLPRLLWLLIVVGAVAGIFAAAIAFTEAANQREATVRNADTTNQLLTEVRDLGEANQAVLETIRNATSPEAQQRNAERINAAVDTIVNQLAARLSCPR